MNWTVMYDGWRRSGKPKTLRLGDDAHPVRGKAAMRSRRTQYRTLQPLARPLTSCRSTLQIFWGTLSARVSHVEMVHIP